MRVAEGPSIHNIFSDTLFKQAFQRNSVANCSFLLFLRQIFLCLTDGDVVTPKRPAGKPPLHDGFPQRHINNTTHVDSGRSLRTTRNSTGRHICIVTESLMTMNVPASHSGRSAPSFGFVARASALDFG